MLLLRVRCVDDGRELLLERHGADEHSIRVAELKQLVLQQRQRLNRPGDTANASDPQGSDLEESFVLLRGQILADPDVVDLNALSPSDFFVFAVDAPQPRDDSGSGGEMQQGNADSATLEVLRSQLVDMGFSSGLAAQALQQCGNNLLDAASLLAEGKVRGQSGGKGSKDGEEGESSMGSIAPLRNLVQDASVTMLRRLAATDSFQALTLLKEQFSSETLNQLNENPVATLRMLSLPAPTRAPVLATEQLNENEVIDVETIELEETQRGESNGAIDRLTDLGFARDLVEVMYESCGGDEQLTANALLQTLES
ncbi:Ubiquitin-associated/translation elongation factor EF1B, N-terminal, eukaryote [Phytophthora cinnamomi]|uniref:Ubiquitin-associated/translation elongation factor EF1B, N-terminal, eukaryote n=1 Tax=Phytophthora cinnamomi TaxID=4785 RepID=UPI002A33761F|nr:Ubiquitin-associated/translation elongation factor EF1B, N-terminal, eukaryote [Phytophthora cinnamomi]KAJ8533297.1 hypothetical protein ON010_g13957 [Phytophthora cinnamomi]